MTPHVLSKTTSAAVAAPGSASPIDTSTVSSASFFHWTPHGIDRKHDQCVDPLVDQALGQGRFDHRVVRGVDDQRLPLGVQQPAPERGGDALLPDVIKGSAQHAHVPSASEGERAGDRIDLIADAIGRLTNPLLGLGRNLQAPKGVRNCRRRQAGLGRDVAQRRTPAPVGHAARVRGLSVNEGAMGGFVPNRQCRRRPLAGPPRAGPVVATGVTTWRRSSNKPVGRPATCRARARTMCTSCRAASTAQPSRARSRPTAGSGGRSGAEALGRPAGTSAAGQGCCRGSRTYELE